MREIFSPTGQNTNAPELQELCYSYNKPEGPIYGSTNVLTFVFVSNGYSNRRGFFISVSAGIKMFMFTLFKIHFN